ncbi:hypothetical protein [Actinoplanes utahensis]|uniref:Uncharacterized protein n=1 Tax=Actinoplanes utahensis TaxID=1869 RepID=A0A0A6UB43_ACTUT|nr:hypothetical protein [Actinoplanes utahensis]KHD72711.1 hypothetical protein MB27_40585 [Actinoplanes utahensis]GIF29123.1 hypothetical protein Aut01nite_21090 [Actinoplanes utahensis]
MSADLWPSVPAVLRVMTGWALLGVGLLDIAVEVDGGLTRTYLVFHLMIVAGGVLLLLRQRLAPSRAGLLVTAGTVVAATALTALPGQAGYPFPFWGDGAGVDRFHLGADLLFWGCAGLLLAAVLAQAERFLPERRTPIDLSRYGGHAEVRSMAATPDRAGENVGGLT